MAPKLSREFHLGNWDDILQLRILLKLDSSIPSKGTLKGHEKHRHYASEWVEVHANSYIVRVIQGHDEYEPYRLRHWKVHVEY